MEQRNAIVTGASRGIGRAIVEKFARNGINMWACASRENGAFEADMKGLEEKYQVWIEPLYFDLSREEEIKDAVRKIRNEKKPVDILVNNAGISKVANLSMLSMDQIHKVFECNFFGPLLLTQSVQRLMMKVTPPPNAHACTHMHTRNKVIVNIGSVSGLYPDKGYSAYGSSKAALMFFSKILAMELAPFHIRVNSVAPGFIDTEMISYKKDELVEEIIENIWLKRKGEPEEVANIVYFLTTDAAAGITGKTIRVDGGYGSFE